MAQNKLKKSPTVVVIGDGWAALGAVSLLSLEEGERVLWISGTGSRLQAPLPSLEAGVGARAWELLALRMGIEAGEALNGSYLREFRNKAFREPAWTKAPTPEARREVLAEEIWEGEASFAAPFESRFRLGLGELEEALRAKIAESDSVTRLEEDPVQGFRMASGQVEAVLLGSGEEIACRRVIYADRWTALAGLEGLPKPLSFLRGREAMGALQATFTHSPAIGADLLEGFYGPIQRESGEEFQRHVWGWFSADGSRSVWTVALGSQEVEDNHEIAKKLRRLKQALDKMFTGAFLPNGKAEFSATVKDEQVRFEEGVLFSKGAAPDKPVELAKAKGLSFLTDGYGPSSALAQVVDTLGIAVGVESLKPASSESEAPLADDRV